MTKKKKTVLAVILIAAAAFVIFTISRIPPPLLTYEEELNVIEAAGQIPEFSSVDLHGNEVTNDIFKGKRVTMINIWGTYCKPCVEEMPDLGSLARSAPEGSQVVGIVNDARGEKQREAARQVMEASNAEFTQIVADKVLLDYLKDVRGVPTTIFVDENGVRIGEPIIGGPGSEEEFRAAIEALLQ